MAAVDLTARSSGLSGMLQPRAVPTQIAAGLQAEERDCAAECAENPTDSARRVRWVRCLIRLDRWDEAQDALSNGLGLAPASADLLVEQASLLRRTGQLEAAEAALLALKERHAHDPRLPQLSAALAESAGDLDTAARIYAENVAANPNDSRRRVRWVRCLIRLDRWDEAQEALSNGLATTPSSADLLAEQVSLKTVTGQLEAAEAALRALKEVHPDDARLIHQRSALAEAAGDLETATRIHAAEVAANPTDSARRVRWARGLLRLGRYVEAQAALSEGLALAPASANLLAEQVSLLMSTGQQEAAETALLTLQEQHPRDARLSQLRGALAEAAGDVDAALRAYAAEAAGSPNDSARRVRWVRCLLRLGRHDEAQAALSDGLALAPASTDLLAEQVSLLNALGQIESAEVALLALQERHPRHARLPQLRGALAEAAGDLERAARIYAAEATARPHGTERLLWVRCLRKLGRIAEAIAILREISSPTLAEREILIECLMESGQWDEVPGLLERWANAEQQHGIRARTDLRMRFANLLFDHDPARQYAEGVLTTAPDDRKARFGLARSEAGAFHAELAWQALRQLPGTSPDGGPPQKGAGALRSTLGQIVNELRLRPSAAEELAAAAELNDDALIEAATRQLRSDPGNFGAALGLLVGLGRARYFDALLPSASLAETKIPKKLHQFWDCENPPPDVKGLMAAVRGVNDNCKHLLWNDASARKFIAELGYRRTLMAYKLAHHAAMKADILRLLLLYTEGGMYLDADDCCERPLEILLPADAELVCYQEDLGSIGNNFLAARPGHPLIGDALREATKAVLDGARESIWLATGPGLLSRVIAGAIAHSPCRLPPEGVYVLPLRVLRTVIRPHRRMTYKADKRHWSRAA